jgi:hypothetical protein
MGLIQIENNPRYRSNGTVLSNPHAAHAIHVDAFLRVAVGDCAGKVEQDPVWVHSRFTQGLNRRSESNFHAQAGSVPGHSHILDVSRASSTLRRSARHHEQARREMFPIRHHFFPTLASAPLDSRAVAGLISFPGTCVPNRGQYPVSRSLLSSHHGFSTAISAAMALVAVHTVVHIATDVRVMEVVRISTSMATGALKNRVVI